MNHFVWLLHEDSQLPKAWHSRFLPAAPSGNPSASSRLTKGRMENTGDSVTRPLQPLLEIGTDQNHGRVILEVRGLPPSPLITPRAKPHGCTMCDK